MSKFRRAPYPHLTSPKGPKHGWVWVVWRWCGADTVPPESWWFTLERSRDDAREYAHFINTQHEGKGHPKAYAARVRL